MIHEGQKVRALIQVAADLRDPKVRAREVAALSEWTVDCKGKRSSLAGSVQVLEHNFPRRAVIASRLAMQDVSPRAILIHRKGQFGL